MLFYVSVICTCKNKKYRGKFEVTRKNDKFGKTDWSQFVDHMQVLNVTEPGVRGCKQFFISHGIV